MTYYAVVESSTVWGVGKTELEAKKNALEFLSYNSMGELEDHIVGPGTLKSTTASMEMYKKDGSQLWFPDEGKLMIARCSEEFHNLAQKEEFIFGYNGFELVVDED